MITMMTGAPPRTSVPPAEAAAGSKFREIRRPSGQAAVFTLADGRRLEVAVAGATGVQAVGDRGRSRFELLSAQGRTLSHLDLAGMLAVRGPARTGGAG